MRQAVWVDWVTGAPWKLHAFAKSAQADLDEHDEVYLFATDYLDVKEAFEQSLARAGVSFNG